MRGLAAAPLLGALTLILVGLGLSMPASAAGGHSHDQGPAKKRDARAVAEKGSSNARVTAGSETFELLGVLLGDRLIIELKRKSDGAPVKDARIEIAVDSETAVATPLADGTYALKTPALTRPGAHEIIATITAGSVSDLLVGTLAAAPDDHGAAFDHDHAAHHGKMDGGGSAYIQRLVGQPLVAAGLALGLVVLGAGLAQIVRARPLGFAKPMLGGGLIAAAALFTAGMVQAPPAETRAQGGHSHGAGDAHAEERPEGAIEMPADRIAAARIIIADAQQGILARKLTVPGVIVPDSGRLARAPAQVVGTVAEMRKVVGDPVTRGEVIAIITSREVADAKSEYLAAVVNLDLQRTLFERSQALWEKRVTPEQQFLQVKATYTQAELRTDLARQKLSSLGLDAKTVAQEAKEDATSQGPSRLRTYEVRAPLTGRIVERKVEVGTPVGKEGDASELYTIADLSTVWVELSVPLGDLDAIKERQRVTIRNDQRTSDGGIVFVSPIVNAETRSARVVAAIDNAHLSWRPGTFVSAQVAFDAQHVAIRIPRAAVQTIEGKPAVFVRTAAGFEKREVSVGRGDNEAVEIVAGLSVGEPIAISNTFLLKADLGKAEAEHSH